MCRIWVRERYSDKQKCWLPITSHNRKVKGSQFRIKKSTLEEIPAMQERTVSKVIDKQNEKSK